MENINLIDWATYFYIYCFLGWIFESTYVSMKSREWINRGFLHGPMLPIYGSGAVMMLVVSQPFHDNLILTYFAGVVGATLLELVVGWGIEKIFKVRYWDYSYKKYHYHGYICLSSSIAWGFFTIIMNEFIHPVILMAVEKIPYYIVDVVFSATTIIFILDVVASVKAALAVRNMIISLEEMRREMQIMKKRADVVLACMDDTLHEFLNAQPGFERMEKFVQEMNDKFEKIKSENEIYSRLSDRLVEEGKELRQLLSNMSERTSALRGKMDMVVENRIRSNPSMNSAKYKETLEVLKESIKQKRRGIK